MGLIDNILKNFGYVSEKDFTNKVTEAVKSEIDKTLPYWLAETADAARYDIPEPNTFATQADMYRLSPILGTAVSILGSDIGTSTFNVKRIVGEETRDIPNHPLELLLRNPNPIDSGMEFMEGTVIGKLLNGNYVWWMNKADANSEPDELWPIPFSMITPVPDKRMYIDHYNYFPGDGRSAIPLETWEIVHFKSYNPNNRFVGMSPLESLAVTLRGDLSMRSTNTINYSKHGGAPPSILGFKDFVPEPQWKDIKENINLSTKRDEMMLLRGTGEGVSWLQRALSNKDMMFVEGLKQNMTDVFNRMCPGLLSMLSENATEANALAARATYSEKTEWPMMESIAQKITSDVLPPYGRKLIGVFDDPRIVDRKLELEEQMAFERSHTVEEVRKEYYEDTPLGDDRDKLLMSEIAKGGAGGVGGQPVQPKPADPLSNQMGTGDATSDPAVHAVKAQWDDLRKMERAARKRVGKPLKWGNHILAPDVQLFIETALPACKSETDVITLFAKAKERMTSPKTAADVLESIRLGVSALESKHA